MINVTITTDGSCAGNPGPGGWAAIIQHNGKEKVLTGCHPHTTNNKMEMMAALEGLRALKVPCKVRLRTDSRYLEQAFTKGWIRRWKRNGWRTLGQHPVKNRDLWEALWEEAERHMIQWVKVKGHANDALNNRADRLAVKARKGC